MHASTTGLAERGTKHGSVALITRTAPCKQIQQRRQHVGAVCRLCLHKLCNAAVGPCRLTESQSVIGKMRQSPPPPPASDSISVRYRTQAGEALISHQSGLPIICCCCCCWGVQAGPRTVGGRWCVGHFAAILKFVVTIPIAFFEWCLQMVVQGGQGNGGCTGAGPGWSCGLGQPC